MDLLNSATTNNPLFFSNIKTKNPLTYHLSTSKFYKKSYLSFSTTTTTTTRRNFVILAHFGGGPTTRRNSLRRKLIDDQKVRQNPISLDPIGSSNDIDSFRENLNGASVKRNDFDDDDVVVVESSSSVKELKLNDVSVKRNDFDDDDDVVVESSSSVKELKLNDVSVKRNDFDDDDDVAVESSSSVKESEKKGLGESVLLSKLENWVDQYKKDSEYWGIGSGSIFTVFQDLKGNVERVLVNEDEILKRSRVERQEFEDLSEVNSKILYAKSLAREMERGNNVIPKNSSVAKFVVSSGKSKGFVNVIRGVILQPECMPKISRVGRVVLFGFVAVWALKKLFDMGKKEVAYTDMEKEMMRRKLKAREEKKEMLVKGSVEVVEESAEPAVVSFEKPKLDKQELMNSILKAKASKDKLALLDSSSSQTAKYVDFDDKIQEIREMARRAREIERSEHSLVDQDGEEKQAVDEDLSSEMEEGVSFQSNLPNRVSGLGIDETILTMSLDEPKSDDTGFLSKVASLENGDVLSSLEVLKDRQSITEDSKDSETPLHLTDTREAIQSSDTSGTEPSTLKKRSIRANLKVIRSVKEAREYLSKKRDRQDPNQESQVKIPQESSTVSRLSIDKESVRNTSQMLDADNKVFRPATSGGASESTHMPNACENSIPNDRESVPTKMDDPEDSEEEYEVGDSQKLPISSDHKGIGGSTETRPSLKTENWIEENFHEFEPVLEKIGVGFRDNYMVAKEKASQQLNVNTEMTQLGAVEDDSEFEWMKDDRLREIVFQVRENELTGRDPFYLMDAEDKLAFFQGLEKKVEKENEKLSHLHEYLHSNIENLDYGADGISLYDPPEKFIPRWKGSPLEKNPEFLNEYLEQRKAIFSRNSSISSSGKKNEHRFPQKSAESSDHENVATSLAPDDIKKKYKDPKDSKTVIESSDGSVKSGKKSGKEYWQHTKKWSDGFFESYNAETDPEVKSTMKDIGKDLDRWITEKEIQEAADLMTTLPEKNKEFMEKKLNKLKREMELFGPQAVVSKYREYAEEKEEDFLWWLDLPHVLGIELYTSENGEQKIGFYSLEMAADLELEPKPYHVIAFEDAGDCKNFCYIIQAHMDMLGNGHAFVVSQPPKDAFREAKANGFSVTVIRKGELQLNVDQTLEEVEEQIMEIGSKIYHDKIMQERSVDISSLMKGVFGPSDKPTKRKRSKRRLKKPS